MRTWSWVLAATVFASGCGSRSLEPEPVRIDQAHCAYCDMIISDERNAAQAVSAREDTRFYDDIGCLVRDPSARRPGARLYARAAGDTAWLPVETAWFALPAGLQTPMGYGLAAYATEAEAKGADRDGRAFRFADLAAAKVGRP